jgi:hypothetical protein
LVHGSHTLKMAEPGVNGLAVQYARADVRKHSFTVRVVELWNSLLNSLRAEKRPKSFKTQGGKVSN